MGALAFWLSANGDVRGSEAHEWFDFWGLELRLGLEISLGAS